MEIIDAPATTLKYNVNYRLGSSNKIILYYLQDSLNWIFFFIHFPNLIIDWVDICKEIE